MTRYVAAERPGRYVLHVDRETTGLPFLTIRIERDSGASGSSFVLPALQSTDYFVRLDRGTARFFVDDAEVRAAWLRRGGARDLLRAVERPRVAARLRLVVDDGLSIQPLLRGSGRKGRALTKTMRALTGRGFGLASANLQRTPELLFDLNSADAPKPTPQHAGRPRFAVALHLFYEELWPEFEHFLRRIRQPFRLIITTPVTAPTFADDARRAFPDVQLVTVPNRGRDVGPFLQLLNDGRLDGFEFVLKLHGKRMVSPDHLATLGHVWRRASLIDLAGSDETVCRILSRFDQMAEIGMIGSSRFRMPGLGLSEKTAWGSNRRKTLALAERLGINGREFRLDYFAGTMFWVRRDTLESLRRLRLVPSDFPEERGQRDGELHHALERLFGTLPGLVGQRLEGATIRFDR